MGTLTLALIGAVPWIGLGAFLGFGIREPRPLPPPSAGNRGAEGANGDPPLVSVVVPARDEEGRVGRCVAGLVRQEGVRHEVIVVDDRSTDATAREAREAAAGSRVPLRILDGRPLPDGWFGKPWACHQGAAAARGELLLFTDADTVHHPTLLARCLAALDEDRAAALSLLGHQELETFWERLVQPQIFALMGIRFRGLDRVLDHARWQGAIANGQYILVRRDAYDSIGGHGAVRTEVVEDLRLAQELTRARYRLTIRKAEDAFATRMYTSLRSLVDGWTKNVAVGARQAAGRLGSVAAPGILLFLMVAWILPPLAAVVGLAGGLFTSAPPVQPGAVVRDLGALDPALAGMALWGGMTWALTTLVWVGGYQRFGVSRFMAFLYPVGSAVVFFIVTRSWVRGSRRIEWKGRVYRTSDEEVGGTP